MCQRAISKKDQYSEVKKKARKNQIWSENHEISSSIGKPRSLNIPIRKYEVEKTAHKAGSNKAVGEDKIPTEIVKYAPESAKEKISQIYSNIFLTHSNSINNGKSKSSHHWDGNVFGI